MSDSNSNPPRDTAPAPATQPKALDANGFDPTEFEWRPVPRRARSDGWTPEVQRAFIEALARTGVVERACQEVGMGVSGAYALRNSPGGAAFARAWSNVLTAAADRLLDIAFEHAIEGEEIPVFDQDGIRVGAKRKYNTRMAMFLLRAYHPERFRHAHKDVRTPDEAPPPAAVPVAEATATLVPITPAEPQKLMPPGQLGAEIAYARRKAAEPAQDEREPYRFKGVPAAHPAVQQRAEERKLRRELREERDPPEIQALRDSWD